MRKMQLHIPAPCHEDWDAMVPAEQGRYCQACATQVIDFTCMSDEQLLAYFSNLKNEQVCGRVFTGQLNRNITAPPKRKWLWYWNYILAFFLLFTKTNQARAQGRARVEHTTTDTAVTSTEKIKSITHHVTAIPIEYRGRIVNEDGAAVSFASVTVEGVKKGIIADANGNFLLHGTGGDSTVNVSAVGFGPVVAVLYTEQVNTIVIRKSALLMPEVTVTPFNSTGRLVVCTTGAMSCRRKKIWKDTVTKWWPIFSPSIKIYPSPVLKGSTFTIALQLKSKGRQEMQIMDAAGRLVLQKEINALSTEQKETIISSSSWSSGVYFVRVVNNKNKILAGSFLVE